MDNGTRLAAEEGLIGHLQRLMMERGVNETSQKVYSLEALILLERNYPLCIGLDAEATFEVGNDIFQPGISQNAAKAVHGADDRLQGHHLFNRERIVEDGEMGVGITVVALSPRDGNGLNGGIQGVGVFHVADVVAYLAQTHAGTVNGEKFFVDQPQEVLNGVFMM